MASDDDDIRDALEEIRGYIAEARSETEAQRASAAAERAKNAAAEETLEKERRSGVHGRDWQVLQERIDMKRTTEADVLGGLDHSPEAEAVRRQAQKGLIPAREVALGYIEEDDATGQLDELKRAQEELARTVAQLSQFRNS